MTEKMQDNIKTDIIKEKEKKVSLILKSKGVDKNFKNFRVDYIEEGVYSVGSDKGISFYCKENGENIFHIGGLEQERYVKNGEASKIVGYAIKEHQLYKIIGYKGDKPILDNNPINEYSVENFKIWSDICFYSDILSKTQLISNPTNLFSDNDLKSLEGDIDIMIESGSITIYDIETLLKQKKINKEYFNKALSNILQNHLANQCRDERLDKTGQGITKEILVDYYHKGYPITKEIGKQCMDNFKLKKGKIEEKKEIMKDTRSSLPNAIS